MPIGHQDMFEFADILKRFSSDQSSDRVDRLASFFIAPHAHCVKVFERESKRIHAGMTRTAERFVAMQFEDFSKSRFAIFEFLLGLLQLGKPVGGVADRLAGAQVFLVADAMAVRRAD